MFPKIERHPSAQGHHQWFGRNLEKTKCWFLNKSYRWTLQTQLLFKSFWSFEACSESQKKFYHSVFLRRTILPGKPGCSKHGLHPILPGAGYLTHHLQNTFRPLFLNMLSTTILLGRNWNFCRWEKLGPEKLSTSPKLTQPVNGRAQFKPRHFHHSTLPTLVWVSPLLYLNFCGSPRIP